MKLWQEIQLYYLIPTIRKELAMELRKNKLNLEKIGEKLFLTKSAVSNYINDKRGTKIKIKPTFIKKIKESAIKINEGTKFVNELNKLCEYAKTSGCLCNLHKQIDKTINKECDICGWKK